MRPDPVSEFIYQRSILILDRNSVPRAHLQRLMLELGASPDRIFPLREASEASVHLDRFDGIILCDDSIGFEKVIELARKHRENPSHTPYSLFLLITSNTSQISASHAVEAGVDGFVLRPCSREDFGQILLTLIRQRLEPSRYEQELEKGRELLFNGDCPGAIRVLEQAVGLHPNPASARFYLAQAYHLQKLHDQAKETLRQGIEDNQLHFHCLTGMFETLRRESRMDEAYEVIRRVVAIYPGSPERLATAVEMAVRTRNFTDVDNFYEFFMRLTSEQRTPELRNHLGAALAVNGRYHLIRNAKELALENFDRSVETGNWQEKFVDYALKALLKHGFFDEATDFAMKYAFARRRAQVA